MAVAHSGEANQTATFTGVNSFNITSQTSAGSDRIGVVHIGGFLGVSGSTAATWGGSSATVSKLGAGGDAILLHYVAPATSASTVAVSGLNVGSGAGGASTYTGADQSAGSGPISNTSNATGTTASPATTTCTTAAGEMVVDACGAETGGAPYAAGANQNQVLNAATDAYGLGSYQLGADGGVMSWTFNGTRYWEIVAASIKAVAAAGDPEGRLVGGKLVGGGLLRGGVLVGRA